MALHIGVKRRQRDPAELHGFAVLVFLNDDVGARFLILELDLVAHDFDRLALGRIGRVRGDDEEPHFGSLLAPNLIDDFIETHIAHVVKFRRTLRDCGDAIAHFDAAVFLRGTARDQAFDFGVAVFGTEHGADADKRESHVDAEIIQIGLAQIFGVRVVGLRERGEEKFYLLGFVLLMHVAHEAIVAAGDELGAGLDRMFAE